MSKAKDTIQLTGLAVRCIVGIYAPERERPQPLVVDAALRLDLGVAGRAGDLAASVDYARLARELAFILEAGRFRLLESAALALLAHMLTPHATDAVHVVADEAEITIAKPEALGGAATPSLRMTRTRRDIAAATRKEGSGLVQVLLECPETTVARLYARDDATWPFAGPPPRELALSVPGAAHARLGVINRHVPAVPVPHDGV